MDEYTERRGGGGLAISRRGSSLSCRDTSDEDRSIQCSNQLGGGTRLSSMKGTNTINQEKSKCSKPSFHFSSSKTTVGSSSSTGLSNPRKHHQDRQNSDTLKQAFTGISNFRKHHREQQNPVEIKESVMGMRNLRKHHQEQQQNTDPLKATVITVSKRRQQEVEADRPSPSTTRIQTGQTGPQNAETVAFHGLSKNATENVGYTRPQKPFQQSENVTQDTSMGSSIQHSFSSKNANQYPNPKDQGANVRRYGLRIRSIGCASISDIIPSNSMSDLGRSRKINVMKQRCHTNGESSSSRGKKTGESSKISSHRNDFSNPSLLSTVCLSSQPSSRRLRNQSLSSSVPSIRTRRRISVDTSTRESRSNNVNIMIPLLGQAEFSNNESASGSSSQSFSTEHPSAFLNSLRWPGSSNETTRSSRPTHPVNSSARPFDNFSLAQDGFRHLNMEITEALLALERAEQAEELSYEQLLALESNLFLGGISFFDQHGGMRLDIDNMSYEELLALEEKMGTVRIALTEEELSNCVKRSCYVPAHMVPGVVGHDDDDAKCSICQEEYAVGDEVGKLGCRHRYHVTCIYQWLKQKNWCPICKALAAPS